MDHSERIQEYFPGLSDTQQEQFELMGKLYSGWNARINLVSRKDIGSLYINHVLHSLAIARFISFRPGSSVFDAGTGGGFPGLPLAVFFPEVSFTLVDSVGKKIKAVVAIATALGLKNVIAINDRIENIPGNYDFAVSRAVTGLSVLYGWLKDKISYQQINERKNGIISLKGGDLTKELADLKKPADIVELSEYFTEAFFNEKKIIYVPV